MKASEIIPGRKYRNRGAGKAVRESSRNGTRLVRMLPAFVFAVIIFCVAYLFGRCV